ncbi:CCR4-NOT transcription complex subunit like [Actinidia chinensis var. chinensis]|uniref:CCR4-NOT transcription complex subunit like n=1 Tax=Actinidia chinensis var. chinensis TaxID=1590841 RepID=A0A2R6QGT1_ACTCC|nr:CCR4-NOT transcription complex subunit like [Actinidia chinensis var. chinensis]
MLSDSIANASIPMAASNSKDFSKKKRANRSAKLKQCKLDARREQWLSQGKNKGCKGESDGYRGCNESERSIVNLEINPRGERNVGLTPHCSDSDSPSNSPTSHTSSILGSNVSGTNFTTSSGTSSSSSGGSCSGSITGEDGEGEDECLDDWEAVADALAAINDKQDQDNPCSEPSVEHESITQLDSASGLTHQQASKIEKSNPKSEHVEKVRRDYPTCRAWKPDDAFRPQSLPNLSKQLSLPMDSGRHCGWGCKKVSPVPSSCPICCEDLDLTDSSFLPCSCGFRLCLFCHKRILEEDGRCPGCRKQYGHEPAEGEATVDGSSLTIRLARSCSMIMRS